MLGTRTVFCAKTQDFCLGVLFSPVSARCAKLAWLLQPKPCCGSVLLPSNYCLTPNSKYRRTCPPSVPGPMHHHY